LRCECTGEENPHRDEYAFRECPIMIHKLVALGGRFVVAGGRQVCNGRPWYTHKQICLLV
jgi:hypothetical protein